MADTKEKYPKNPTPEQIAEWKNLYGSVHRLIFEPEYEMQSVRRRAETQEEIDLYGSESETAVEDEVEVEVYPEAICYLKSPSRKDLAYAQQAAVTGGQFAFNSAMLNNCFIGGDPIVKTKDSYFLGAGPHIAEIIEIKECKLEKL